jgi:hypothetical protein
MNEAFALNDVLAKTDVDLAVRMEMREFLPSKQQRRETVIPSGISTFLDADGAESLT